MRQWLSKFGGGQAYDYCFFFQISKNEVQSEKSKEKLPENSAEVERETTT